MPKGLLIANRRHRILLFKIDPPFGTVAILYHALPISTRKSHYKIRTAHNGIDQDHLPTASSQQSNLILYFQVIRQSEDNDDIIRTPIHTPNVLVNKPDWPNARFILHRGSQLPPNAPQETPRAPSILLCLDIIRNPLLSTIHSRDHGSELIRNSRKSTWSGAKIHYRLTGNIHLMPQQPPETLNCPSPLHFARFTSILFTFILLCTYDATSSAKPGLPSSTLSPFFQQNVRIRSSSFGEKFVDSPHSTTKSIPSRLMTFSISAPNSV